jgi:phenylacetate-coenzyme A ligase PaaK-like adenylate-forming protein
MRLEMNFSFDEIYNIEPYKLNHSSKQELHRNILNELTRYHYEHCSEYKKIVQILNYDPSFVLTSEEQPMLPVRLFKEYELMSVPKENIVKTMTSSGTTGQSVSKIFLSKENMQIQTKVLVSIITSFLSKSRMPLIILDTDLLKTDRTMFSARGAGTVGFMIFGSDVIFALDQNMNLNISAIKVFLDKHKNETILFFGYTYMIWQHIICSLRKNQINLNIPKGILFHSGGWKKLKDQAVDTLTYNKAVCEVLGNITVHNYYGMAEQLGSIFVECEYGHMHCSIYSDVIIRRYNDFSCAEIGEKGFIELLSLLPVSYPGHVLLTEDEGEIIGEDDCPCGRLGKYFKIHGRVKGAEVRGCSDTYEQR